MCIAFVIFIVKEKEGIKEESAEGRQGTDGSELLQTEEQDRGNRRSIYARSRMNRKGLRRELGTGLGTEGKWAKGQNGERVKVVDRMVLGEYTLYG